MVEKWYVILFNIINHKTNSAIQFNFHRFRQLTIFNHVR